MSYPISSECNELEPCLGSRERGQNLPRLPWHQGGRIDGAWELYEMVAISGVDGPAHFW